MGGHIGPFGRVQAVVRRVRTAIFLVLFSLASGTIGYMLIEGARFFDAYYMSVITLASVGFGEVFPLSTAGRLFTSVLIIFNIGLFTYSISTLTGIVAEGGASKLLNEFLMIDRINALQGHTIVCGFGRHATEVTKELGNHGIPFVVIEKNHHKLARLHDAQNCLFIEGDATDDDTLRTAGIERAASIVVTLPSDADNLFIVLSARQMNPQLRIISRSNSDADAVKLRRAGADHVVVPESIGGFYMATLVNKPDLVEFFTLLSNMGPSNVVFEEIAVRQLLPKYQNRSIAESHLDTECRIPVVALRHPNGQYDLNPEPTAMLRPETHIVVFGNPDQMQRFRQMALAEEAGGG